MTPPTPRAWALALLPLAAGLCGCSALSTDGLPATPQRPTLSSDTNTTAAGTFELEAGVQLVDGGNGSSPLTLKHGLGKGTEVYVGWSPWLELARSGPGDVFLGARHRLVDETEGRPAFALQSQLKLPTADEDRGLGSGEVDFNLAGIATKSGDAWSLTGFLQLDLLGDPDGGVDLGQSLAVAGGYALSDEVGAFGEVAGVVVPENDTEDVFTTLGLTFAPDPDLVLDLGVVLGLSEDANDFAVVLGFTRNFGRLAAARRP